MSALSATPSHPAYALRLSTGDIDQLKRDAIDQWPGVWLHHFGVMLEEAVLARHAIPFRSTQAPVTEAEALARRQAQLSHCQQAHNQLQGAPCPA